MFGVVDETFYYVLFECSFAMEVWLVAGLEHKHIMFFVIFQSNKDWSISD